MRPVRPRRFRLLPVIAAVVVSMNASASASGLSGSTDVRLTNDVAGGYMSTYTIATGRPYPDAALTECSRSRGRQNEPADALDPRNPDVIVGSSNDYCAV